MKPFPLHFKIVAIVSLTSLVVLIGLLNLRDRLAWSDPWDGVYWKEAGEGLRADAVVLDGPGERAGIRVGDLLVDINSQAISDLGQYSDRLFELGVNAKATYSLAYSGSNRTVSLILGERSLLAQRDGPRILLAFLYLAIGLFVILRGSHSPRAFHFYFICLASFTVYLYSFTPKLGALDWTVYGLSVGAFLLLPALFIHFCMRFPVELATGKSRAPFVYLAACALGLMHLLWMAGRLADFGLPRTADSSQLIDRIHLIYFCVGLIAGGVLLWRRRAQARDLTTRQQMRWVSYGTLAGIVPFSLIYAIPVLLGARSHFAMESSMLFLSFIPLSFAYAIIHYRLLDVEILVRRGVAYFIASSLLLSIYLFFVLVVGKALEWIAPETDFVVICIAALAIALLFAPLRNRIQERLDRFFYKERFDDRASLLDFARMLSTEISLGRLARSILERVSTTFGTKTAALFLSDPIHPGCFRLTDELGLDISGFGDSLLFRPEELINPADSNELPGIEGVHHFYRTQPALSPQGIHYVQDLQLRGRRIGMIGLGPLPEDKHFSTEDLDLLAALAGYAAIALENANLYRSVEVKAFELEHIKIYTENIIESINVAVLVLDLDGKITSCNRAFEELYHVRRDGIRKTPVEELFAPDVISSIQKVTGVQNWKLNGTSGIFKLYLENRRSESLIVNLSIIPMVEATDQTTGCIIVIDDVTQKVRLENQLLQAEKLSSIGLLAAGIAHEVNTPIAGISSYTQMLLKGMPASDHRKEVLEKIEKQTFRAAEIVNGLLNFARMNGSEFEDLDVNQLIQESLALLDHQMRQNHIRVDSQLDHTVPNVYGNGGKLQQVFINLLLNARDAMPKGGNLKIGTAMNESMVLVDIFDSGVGISEENIKRIYDPFFTTKTIGKGTGLGLAVTYGIIQEHGGRIFVDSAPGEGTHFRLKLPTRRATQANSL